MAAAHVTDRDTHDSPLLPGLVTATAQHFNVEQVSVDKGYSSHANIEAIRDIGATPFVALTGNAKRNSKSALWNKAFHYFR